MATSSFYKTFKISSKPEHVEQFERDIEEQITNPVILPEFTEDKEAKERFLERLSKCSKFPLKN